MPYGNKKSINENYCSCIHHRYETNFPLTKIEPKQTPKQQHYTVKLKPVYITSLFKYSLVAHKTISCCALYMHKNRPMKNKSRFTPNYIL